MVEEERIEFSTYVIRDNLIIAKQVTKSDGTILWSHRKIKNTTPKEEVIKILQEFGFLQGDE